MPRPTLTSKLNERQHDSHPSYSLGRRGTEAEPEPEPKRSPPPRGPHRHLAPAHRPGLRGRSGRLYPRDHRAPAATRAGRSAPATRSGRAAPSRSGLLGRGSAAPRLPSGRMHFLKNHPWARVVFQLSHLQRHICEKSPRTAAIFQVLQVRLRGWRDRKPGSGASTAALKGVNPGGNRPLWRPPAPFGRGGPETLRNAAALASTRALRPRWTAFSSVHARTRPPPDARRQRLEPHPRPGTTNSGRTGPSATRPCAPAWPPGSPLAPGRSRHPRAWDARARAPRRRSRRSAWPAPSPGP
jgi:hypothetical protein